VDQLVIASPIMGPVVYITFTIVCIWVLLSMFITIIGDSFSYVRGDQTIIPKDAIVFDYAVRKLRKSLGLNKEESGKSEFGADQYMTGVTYFPTSVDKLVDSFSKVSC
jgi:hypothetical protein